MWTLALGASLGYMLFRKQEVAGQIERSVQQWKASGAKPATDPGANFADVRNAWRSTTDDREYDERLPLPDKAKLQSSEKLALKKEQAWEAAQESNHTIHGVYLDSSLL